MVRSTITMSKLNILGIVRGIKAQTTYLTPIIEAVCNSIDSIGNLPNGTIDIMAIRHGQKSYEGNTSVSGSIIGSDIGHGYRVRTLPLGRDRWGIHSTVGRLHPLVLEEREVW